MELNQANIQEDIFQGFIGYSSSWDFMTFENHYVLPRKPRAIQEKKSSFYGKVTAPATQDIITVQMGNFTEFSLVQVVISPEKGRIDTLTVRRLFIAAVDDAVKSLENSGTLKFWKLNHCNTYLDALICDADTHDCLANALIEVNDCKVFGRAFNDCFKKRIQGHHCACTTFTVATDFTNRSKLEEKSFPYLKMEKFSEIAIEFSQEFHGDDCALFWCRDIVSNFLRTKPDESCYPALLNQLGNFVFNVNRKTEDGMIIPKVYFCGQLFNLACRDDDEAMFTKPIFADFLTELISSQSEKSHCSGWLIAFQKMFESYSKRSHLGAFCNVVIRMPNPAQDSPQRMARHFQEIFGKETKRLIMAYPMENIKKYLNDNLLSPFHTLLTLFVKKIDESEIVTNDDILLANICEPVLCFALYGTTLNIEKEPMFSMNHCQFHKLLEDTFSSGPMFHGLRNLEHISVCDGEIRISAEQLVVNDNEKTSNL